MPWSGHLLAVFEPLQGVPAPLRGDWTAQPGRHPVGDITCPPAFGSVGRRPSQRHPQFLLLLRPEHARRPPRRGVLPVDHGVWALVVVALGDLADPAAGVAGGVRDGRGSLAPSQEPEDLPPAALVWLVGRSLALFELSDAEMRRQMKMSAHASIV